MWLIAHRSFCEGADEPLDLCVGVSQLPAKLGAAVKVPGGEIAPMLLRFAQKRWQALWCQQVIGQCRHNELVEFTFRNAACVDPSPFDAVLVHSQSRFFRDTAWYVLSKRPV
ncbi:MAG: hypothetical protein WBQ17_11050 [Rhizomicrobium sp.]